MVLIVVGLLIALIFIARSWEIPRRVSDLEAKLGGQMVQQRQIQGELLSLSNQLATLRRELAQFQAAPAPAQGGGFSATWATPAPVAEPEATVAPTTPPTPVATPEPATEPLASSVELPATATQEAEETAPAETEQAASPATPAGSAALPAAISSPTSPEPESPAEISPAAEPALAPTQPQQAEAAELETKESTAASPQALPAEMQPETMAEELADSEPIAEEEPAQETAAEPIDEADADPATEPQPVAETAVTPEPEAERTPEIAAEPEPEAEPATEESDVLPDPAPESPAAPAPIPTPQPRQAPPRPPLPPARPILRPKPVPSGPTFWERSSTVLLENWTGILGAVVLVTGVGFLGIYAALRVSPQLRFLLICAFAGVLLGARFALRRKDFARKLNAWLLSSAAAIFLFACVGAVSIPGLSWATSPFDYLLLLAGVSANLFLAWQASRQEIATLHGVLSLVALAVLPPTLLTLGAAAGVTAFSIAITYRQQWKYQLLLSIVSFFAFHLYWHQQPGAVAGGTRLVAMALVLLVGGAAAVVQYRRVYAERRFEPLLFASHLLNWTCLGVNLYLYSTGSIWKTVPLALGAALTFWAGRQARRLGIGWLFQTDTIISLILGLATALSLQGWHATPPVILLFMLLETLLVALIMARQREALVYRVAMSGALLAGAILLLVASGRALDAPPATLYRDALVLALAGWAGLAFVQYIFRQPLLAGQFTSNQESITENPALPTQDAPGLRTHRLLPGLLAGLTGALQAGTGLLLARALFAWPHVPVAGLLGSLAALAGISVGLAAWAQAAPRTPDWVRRQQLGLAQLFAGLAVAGLHEAHLGWPVVLTLLLAEQLGAVLLLARRDALLHRAAMLGALLTGLSLLLAVFGQIDVPRPLLYRNALLLTLAGWGSVTFAQLAFRRFFTPEFSSNNSFADTILADHYRRWLSAFAGLGGLLQLGAGLLVARVLFGEISAPVGLLLGALLGLAAAAGALASWVRRGTVAPGWVRWQQLGLAQAAVLTAIYGLHELGLVWSALLLILFAENLLVAFLLAGHDEADSLHPLAYRTTLTIALLTGLNLLLTALRHLDDSLPTVVYREALLLALAGWLGLAFVQWSLRFPLLLGVKPTARRAGEPAVTLASNPEAHPTWLGYLAGLAGLLQLGTGGLLAKALTGWHPAPVGLLLTALLALAAAALGLAAWVRAAGLAPVWVRRQQVVLGQFFIVLAIFGLHEWGLAWPAVLLVLYLETLVAVLLLARRDGLLHRAAMLGALAAGGSLLLLAATHLDSSPPTQLYRDALLLALAGGVSLAFVQATYKQLLPKGWNRAESDLSGLFSAQLSYLLHSFAGLAGLLQVGTGLLLARVLFGWAHAPVGLLLAALLGLALAALALAAWVRATGLAPDWVRRQQVVIGQFFVVLAIVGLHEVHLSWPAILALLFAENLLVATLLARRDALLHQAALAEALLTGISLLLLAGSRLGTQLPPLLYRDALLLALAGWGSLTFMQFTFRQFSLRNSAEEPADAYAATVRGWLSAFAGLAGFLQAGAGLLLGQVVFKWADTRALGLLSILALVALGLGYWVHRRGAAPRWVRRQQLVLAQLAMLAAVAGLHKLGLTWPAVLAALYAENLLAALLLARRDEEDLLHCQTYLLVVLAALLPILVRSTAPGTLAPLAQAGLLLGAALLTLGYQLRRRALLAGAADYARLPVPGGYRLPLLGVAIGWLLLGAGALQYAHTWAGWVMVGLLGALLYLRQHRAVPGLWLGLLLAALGYVGLQWAHVLPVALAAHLAGGAPWAAGAVLLYLLPTVAVPLGGLLTSWWAPSERFVRWSWLYFLGVQLVVMLLASVPPTHLAYLVLGLLALAGMAFGAAQRWRRSLPDAVAVRRAGQPDRYLLHLCYGLLVAGLLVHLRLLATTETLLHLPAEYFTAAAYFGVLAALAVARPPATAPVYHSWRVLHPWLPEAALAFGSLTLAHHVRTPWLPLVWVTFALLTCAGAARLPLRFRRLMVYGRLYYWLAAASVSATCLLYLNPSQLLSADWWAVASAVALLFGYVALALQVGNAPLANLSPAWRALAQPTRRPLESALLYPALGALALFFIQSFDRSVLTVLLMLEVVAIFSASLLLRRQDLRYVALAGMLASLVRLVFFDLSRSGTVTRAIVFIFMGLLLLGMNALYARFKSRFVVVAGAEVELEEPEDDGELEE